MDTNDSPSRDGTGRRCVLTWNLGDLHPQTALVSANELQPPLLDLVDLLGVHLVSGGWMNGPTHETRVQSNLVGTPATENVPAEGIEFSSDVSSVDRASGRLPSFRRRRRKN